MNKSTTVAPSVTVIHTGKAETDLSITFTHQLSYLEKAVLALLGSGAPMTLPEIEAQLYMQDLSFTQGGLALAILRLQELGLVGNTLAYYPRNDGKGESR